MVLLHHQQLQPTEPKNHRKKIVKSKATWQQYVMCIDQVTFQEVDVTIPVLGLETIILPWTNLEGQPKQYQKAAGRLIEHWLLMRLLGCSRRTPTLMLVQRWKPQQNS